MIQEGAQGGQVDAQRGGGRRVQGCMVGEAMEQFAIEGIDHMGWDAWSGQFIKTSPQDPPLMEVQVKVL